MRRERIFSIPRPAGASDPEVATRSFNLIVVSVVLRISLLASLPLSLEPRLSLSLERLVLLPGPHSNRYRTDHRGADQRRAFRVGVGIPVVLLRRGRLGIISLRRCTLRRNALRLIALRRDTRARSTA